mmetsp:Transcript_3726/g.9044  ORF Transcript_3726/g.9044 Transcript_3726/m.9044 type:complete len:218 (+) Transcript_3726:2022-2675(+)
MQRAVLHAQREAADHAAVVVLDQIQRKVLHEEEAIVLERHPVERVQDGVAGSVCRGRAAVGLPALAELERLTAECPLVDLTVVGPGKWQTKRLELQHNLRRHSAHMLDCVLVAEPVGALHGIVGVPSPVVFRHVRECCIDTPLRRDGVGAGGKHFGNARRVQAVGHETGRRAQTRTAGTHNHGVERVVMDGVAGELCGRDSASPCRPSERPAGLSQR